MRLGKKRVTFVDQVFGPGWRASSGKNKLRNEEGSDETSKRLRFAYDDSTSPCPSREDDEEHGDGSVYWRNTLPRVRKATARVTDLPSSWTVAYDDWPDIGVPLVPVPVRYLSPTLPIDYRCDNDEKKNS
jgi:hypothetical protein